MAITESFEQLAQEPIANSVDVIYTTPVSTQAIIKHIVIVNPTVSDCWVKLWTAGSTDANLILPQVTVDANGGMAEFDGSITLHAGVILNAQGQTNDALTITVHGVELETT